MNAKSKAVKALLLELISAPSEIEVKRIVEDDPILRNEQNWRPYGGYAGNFNTIHNQQQDSVAALAEKPINSIDHLLLNECKLRGINPEGSEAPKSMQEAVELLFGIKKGDFSEVGRQKRREIANNIMLMAEGSRERPNIIIADAGEGQHPSDFEDTFVSLHKGNKDKVRFVQGKYNMGGTGVLRFCGDYHYQLILSRKTPELLQSNQDDKWGFTLVRLHAVTTSQLYKHSWYEYCVDENGEILSFHGETLNILPNNGGFTSGTFIKLFDYYLDDASIIGLGLWRELNRRLYTPALPIMLYEARDYKGHSRTKLMLGNKMRTLVDERDSVEQSLTIPTKLGKFGWRNIEVTLFKEGTSKSEFTTQNDAIFFTINGQTHATIGRSFLRTKAKLYYLADYLLVHIDCTDVETNIREQTFMPNRERMPRDEISKEVEEILANELTNHEGLQKLNQFRREQLVIKNPKDTEFLEGVVSKLIKDNRSLLNYLGLGGGIKDVKDQGDIEIEKYEGKRFPTYLKILSYSSKDKLYRKQIPVNSYARLKLETDAANDYFDRVSENGELKMNPDIMTSFHLWHGIITIKLVPPQGAKVGEIQKIMVELTRPYQDSLFVEFEVEYAPRIQTKVKPHGQEDEDKGKAYKLPEPILVYREKRDGFASWAEHDWTGEDIAKVAPSGGANGDEKSLDVFINMDANVLHDYLRRQQASERQQELIKRSWETSIFLNSLVLYNDLSKLEKEDVIPDIMKSISKITLDLMRNESLLKELEQD
jgi:hypothetical protein